MSNFDYSQRFTRRVINGGTNYERFIWDSHNFGTKYVEPFNHGVVGLEGTQSFVPYTSVKPVRVISLEFPLMFLRETDDSLITGLTYRPEMDFTKLKEFYVRHKSYKSFIYEHPVYGDMLVRFSKPLSMPKKMSGGQGLVQGFSLELQEVIDTSYVFQQGESWEGNLDFPPGYYDVEIEYPDNSSLIPLGSNYTTTFYSVAKDLRTFKLTCSGLKYIVGYDDKLELGLYPDQNMALLEMFYLKYRLNKHFDFEYMGEIISVRFKEPINIPKVNGNNGVISDLEITLIESPYASIEQGTIYERTGTQSS